jgi:chaperonin cofactor prefoldin
MDVAGTAINAAVVAAVGIILAWLGKGRFEALEKQIEARFEALENRVAALERRMDQFQASLDSMRSDLTQIALAVGARHRRAENA